MGKLRLAALQGSYLHVLRERYPEELKVAVTKPSFHRVFGYSSMMSISVRVRAFRHWREIKQYFRLHPRALPNDLQKAVRHFYLETGRAERRQKRTVASHSKEEMSNSESEEQQELEEIDESADQSRDDVQHGGRVRRQLQACPVPATTTTTASATTRSD